MLQKRETQMQLDRDGRIICPQCHGRMRATIDRGLAYEPDVLAVSFKCSDCQHEENAVLPARGVQFHRSLN
jgi:C4-type Zn-finger protein